MSKTVPVWNGSRVRELWPVLVVTLAMAVAATFLNAALHRSRNVVAEELGWSESSAVPGDAGTQLLVIKEWGVQLTLPLAVDMPLMKYATQPSHTSVGLTSPDLERLGPACGASKNALGALVRYPAGSFGSTVTGSTVEHFAGTVGQYDYVYKNPMSGCQDLAGAGMMVNDKLQTLLTSLETFGAATE